MKRMKKLEKQILAAFLCFVLVATSSPATVAASAVASSSNAQEITVQETQVTVESETKEETENYIEEETEKTETEETRTEELGTEESETEAVDSEGSDVEESESNVIPETEVASPSNATNPTICEECGSEEGHETTCPNYVPICTCGTEDDIHDSKCPLYEKLEQNIITLYGANGEVVFASGAQNFDVTETDYQKMNLIGGILGFQNVNTKARMARRMVSASPVPAPQYYYFDIQADEVGEEIAVSGLITAEYDAIKYVQVYHFLDSAEAIANAIELEEESGTVHYFETDDPAFESETSAAAEYSEECAGRVYYTIQYAMFDEDGTVYFETDSYSSFLFVVTFKYNGLEYSLGSGGSVYLSDLMENLGIQQSCTDVEKVEYSDSSLMEIEYMEDAHDWLLTSIGAIESESEEWLTIYFNGGTSIPVQVKEPKVYYFLTDTNGNWESTTVGDVTIDLGTSTDPHDYGDGNNNILIADKDGSYEDQTFKTNKVEIGLAKNSDNGYGEPGSTTHIFLHPGMAIGFCEGFNWYVDNNDASKSTLSWSVATADAGGFLRDGGDWEWCYDSGTATRNYAIFSHTIDTYTVYDQTLVRANTDTGKNDIYYLKFHVVPEKETPALLRDALKTSGMDADYTIKTIPATLYNYDAVAFNSGRAFQFKNYSKGVASTDITNEAGINSGGSSADMGIMRPQLVNGLPVFALGDGGQDYLFSKDNLSGKVVDNVGFEFIYDNDSEYYTYSSLLNHAQYNAKTHMIELYQNSLSPISKAVNDVRYKGASPRQAYGGFYPFADIHDAYIAEADTDYNWTEWAVNLTRDYHDFDESEMYADYAKDFVITSSTNPASTIDMHYGIAVDTPFYLPADGLSDNDQELVFEFTGDDDLWVYIDDQLVLDIGGAHTPVAGSFNITTGEVYVQAAQTLKSANEQGLADADAAKNEFKGTMEFLTKLPRNEMHRLRIFYLERFSGESNCYMRFNLPIVPDNSIYVSKEVVDHENHEFTITPDESYKFQLMINEQGSGFTAASNKTYQLMKTGSSGASDSTGTTNEDGYFYLKDGQTAVFTDIPRFPEGSPENTPATSVYVREILDNQPYTVTQVDIKSQNGDTNRSTNKITDVSSDLKSTEEEISGSGNIRYDFKNYMQSVPLVIEKYVEGGAAALINPAQEFTFKLTFDTTSKYGLKTGEIAVTRNDISETLTLQNATDSNATAVYALDEFSLQQGQSLRIERVPAGLEYSLTELKPDGSGGSFDNPKYTHQVGETVTEDQPSLTFDTAYTNTLQTSAANTTGEADNTNKVTVTNLQRGDLIIQKVFEQGWNRHDAGQTFLFRVNGTPNTHTACVQDLIVTIAEDGTAIVKDLPIGTYTVTELEDWSWRYEVADVNNVKYTGRVQFQHDSFAVSDDSREAEVTLAFNNNRTEVKWLDGNSWCQNIFKFSGTDAVIVRDLANKVVKKPDPIDQEP